MKIIQGGQLILEICLKNYEVGCIFMIYYFTFILLTLLFYLNSLRVKPIDNINSYTLGLDRKKIMGLVC